MESGLWGIKVCHGEKTKIPIKDNLYTIVKNVSLGEISGDAQTLVKATVESIQLEKYNEATNEAPTITNSILIGALTPNKIEQISVTQQYTPLDTVTIEAAGPNDVYITGNYLYLSDEEEEEEEEAIDESCAYDENQVTKSLMDVVINNKLENKKNE